MGDLAPEGRPQSLDNRSTTNLTSDDQQNQNYKAMSTSAPFQSQLNSIPQPQGRPDLRSPAHPTNPHYHAQEHGASSLNMASMAAALPEYSPVEPVQGGAHMHSQSQRPLSGASTSALVYQLQQNMQIPNHAPGSMQTHTSYGHGYDPRQYQHGYMPAQAAQHANYNPYASNQQRLVTPSSMQAQYSNMPQAAPYMYYPPPYGSPGQFSQGYSAPGAPTQMMYGRQPNLNNPPMHMGGQNLDMSQHDGALATGSRIVHGGMQVEPGSMGMPPFGTLASNRSGPVSSIPRGPPRKPKQSGHALWVGNLPPGTTVVALKDHFSRDATKDIESLFLISKSNCAFVNYRTESSCTAAMHRFHDSRFNGVRLVCRLRRSSAPASGVPTGPSAMVGSPPSNSTPPISPRGPDNKAAQMDGVGNIEEAGDAESVDAAEEVTGGVDGVDIVPPVSDETKQQSTAAEKYFIVKSLTLQDLELSVRNGIWATQSHNEETLNEAYQSAENVYLIFSANKSGEYFGYARMASPILEDAKLLVGSAPAPEVLDTTDVPKSIPTPATEFAPKGRIIDDSARGTIFWEADLTDSESEEVDTNNNQEVGSVDGDGPAVAQSWGKPFRIEWISTNRLPFYRTRGLRNPWNQNREVKIARDGTELETSVGERLVQMFHRLGPSNTGGAMQGPPSQLGVPHMRHY